MKLYSARRVRIGVALLLVTLVWNATRSPWWIVLIAPAITFVFWVFLLWRMDHGRR